MSQVSRRLSGVALPLLAAWGLAAACYEVPPLPVFGYENDDLSCSDDLDNDADCLFDCEDPDCLTQSSVCGEIVPEFAEEVIESPVQCFLDEDTGRRQCFVDLGLCRDRVDNDLNGQFDCGDRKCQGIREVCCSRENTNETCSDGIDNDGNSYTDCGDFSCSRLAADGSNDLKAMLTQNQLDQVYHFLFVFDANNLS